MAALIFTLMPAFFGGELQAFARGFPLCILCSDDKKMPYGAALADKLSKRSCLSVKAVLGPRALCNRRANVTLDQHFQGISFQNPLWPKLHNPSTSTRRSHISRAFQEAAVGGANVLLDIEDQVGFPVPVLTEAFKIQPSHGQNAYSCRTQHKLEGLRPTLSQNDFCLRSV